MLAHAVDFQRELQPGDGFTVLFERFRDAEGGLLRDGAGAARRIPPRQPPAVAVAAGDAEPAPNGSTRPAAACAATSSAPRSTAPGSPPASASGVTRCCGFTRMHQGIDFAAPTGTPVLAAADGVVAPIGFAGGYGRLITLQHPDGTETRYAHLPASPAAWRAAAASPRAR